MFLQFSAQLISVQGFKSTFVHWKQAQASVWFRETQRPAVLLTFISFVANFKTLFTIFSCSFLLGFFSIFRYKLICEQEVSHGVNKDHPTEGTNESSPGFSPIILSPVRDNLSSMCCTCSVSSTEELLYLQLVSDPSVASRNRNRMREEAHTISSQLVRDSRNVLWLCRSCGRAEETLFTLFVLGKKRNSPISFIWARRLISRKYDYMVTGHFCWLACYLISMKDSH